MTVSPTGRVLRERASMAFPWMIALQLLALTATAATAATAVPPSGPQPVIDSATSRSVRATAADVFGIAENFSRSGRIDEAERLLELLSQDADSDVRNEARYRHSKLLIAMGAPTRAALLLRRILDEKPNATPVRLELAGLLDKMGDKEGAWRQLRAAQAAGLPPAVARMVDRYSEALRAFRRSGTSFEVALAPDSNINHATSSDRLGTVFGDFEIEDDSKATSGLGMAVRGQTYRRFALGGDGRNLLVRLSGSGNLYKRSRFNDVALDLGAGPELQLGANRINLEGGITQRWFGQKPYMRSSRLGASASLPLGRRAQLRAQLGAALVDNRLNDLADGANFSGQISIERALSATTGVALIVSGLRESLKDPGYSTTSWRFGVLGWRELGRATLTAEAEMGRLRADERLSLFPDNRLDRYLRLSLGTSVRRFGFGGFAPVARVVLERNRSSIAFYDYKRTRTEVGFERAF